MSLNCFDDLLLVSACCFVHFCACRALWLAVDTAIWFLCIAISSLVAVCYHAAAQVVECQLMAFVTKLLLSCSLLLCAALCAASLLLQPETHAYMLWYALLLTCYVVHCSYAQTLAVQYPLWFTACCVHHCKYYERLSVPCCTS